MGNRVRLGCLCALVLSAGGCDAFNIKVVSPFTGKMVTERELYFEVQEAKAKEVAQQAAEEARVKRTVTQAKSQAKIDTMKADSAHVMSVAEIQERMDLTVMEAMSVFEANTLQRQTNLKTIDEKAEVSYAQIEDIRSGWRQFFSIGTAVVGQIPGAAPVAVGLNSALALFGGAGTVGTVVAGLVAKSRGQRAKTAEEQKAEAEEAQARADAMARSFVAAFDNLRHNLPEAREVMSKGKGLILEKLNDDAYNLIKEVSTTKS